MRALKILVVVMGVLIVGGTVALAVVLVQRLGGPAQGNRWQAALEQPEGTRIAGMGATEDGIAVWLSGPAGDRILVVEPRRGRVVGEIRPGR